MGYFNWRKAHILAWSLTGVICAGWSLPGCTHSQAEESMLQEPTPLELQVQNLKAKLAPEQRVRILIRLKEPSPENHARFLEGMKGKEVISAKALTGTPLVLMVITKEGLDRLLTMDMVETIQEDQPQRPSRAK